MSLHVQDDQQLVKAYLRGSEASLEVLINRHKERVYTAIYMFVRDQYLAEDIFQDTFIKVIESLRSGNYKEEGKFLPWVMRIAHNLCIDYFRKVKRKPSIVDSEGRTLAVNTARYDLAVDPTVSGFGSRRKEFVGKLARLTS